MAEPEEKGPLEKPIDWVSGWKASFERIRQRFGMPVAVLLALSVAGGLVWWNWDDIAKRPGVESILARFNQRALPTAPAGRAVYAGPGSVVPQHVYRVAFEVPGRIAAPTMVIWGDKDKALGPGLLDGTLPNCSFPDSWSTSMDPTDCALLLAYWNSQTATNDGWTQTQQAAVADDSTTSVSSSRERR